MCRNALQHTLQHALQHTLQHACISWPRAFMCRNALQHTLQHALQHTLQHTCTSWPRAFMRLRRRSALRCSYTSRNPVSQCVAVCCSVLQCVTVCCSIVLFAHFWEPCVAVYCSMLQCIAVRHSVLQCIVALRCSYTSTNPVSQCVAVCCNSPTGDYTNTLIHYIQ